MRFVPLLMMLILVTFTGCAGQAAKNTSYIAPNTPGGRMCANQCLEAKGYCRETCNLEERSCLNLTQAQAIQDYDKYAREQFFSHQPADLQPRDFERNDKCSPNSCYDDCEDNYKSCYQTCGGKVEVTTSCQFLCF